MFKNFTQALSSGDLQAVITSTIGQIIIVAIALVLLLFAVVLGDRHKKMSVKALTYSSIAIAISFVLSQIKLFSLPQGGSITPFSMLFIILIGYFFGVKTGVLTGIVYGLLQLAFGGWVMHPMQLLLDYPLAFGALGLSGLFANQKHGLVAGILVGSMGRFVFHFLSGIIFFASYAPETWNPFVYSLWYNFSYIGVEGIVTAIVVLIPSVAQALRSVKKSAINNI
ncbi:energy-coupled thiamine transporter ThiT [Vallitaleaceae bacterium 9-2]